MLCLWKCFKIQNSDLQLPTAEQYLPRYKKAPQNYVRRISPDRCLKGAIFQPIQLGQKEVCAYDFIDPIPVIRDLFFILGKL